MMTSKLSKNIQAMMSVAGAAMKKTDGCPLIWVKLREGQEQIIRTHAK
jgi:hypothetical protein